MGVFQDAQAVVLLADYIAVDAAGKINALGAGFMMTSVQPEGLSAPQSVAAIINVPAKYSGQQFAISLELRDLTTGQVAQFPGQGGRAEALRIQQLALAQRPMIQGVVVPDTVPCRHQMFVSFVNGLQVTPGHMYEWRLEIEGQHRPGWSAPFYVLAPPPGPVIGGPTASSDPTAMPRLTDD